MREEQKRLVELAQTVREKSSQSVQLSQEIIKSTNELKEVKGEKDIVNADVQELAQNRVILDADVKTLKEQKEILSKEGDPKKKSFLARVELAASNLAEKGLSALSASEKDTLITSLTMRVNEADAKVSALIKQMPYAESKEIAKLNITRFQDDRQYLVYNGDDEHIPALIKSYNLNRDRCIFGTQPHDGPYASCHDNQIVFAMWKTSTT